jgi:hypothetical protein
MKRFLFTLIAALALVASGRPLEAQTVARTAGEFVDDCKEITPMQGREEPTLILMNGFCLGYLSGLMVLNQLYQDMERGKPFFCAPGWVSPGQARLVFLKYMEEHPEKLHEDAGSMVMVSLMVTFPCESPR